MKTTKENLNYPRVLKEKIGRDYLTGKFSYGKLAELYGLTDGKVVAHMVKWYKKSINFAESISIMEESKDPSQEELSPLEQLQSGEEQDLLGRIRDLERALLQEQLRRTSVELLLEISVEETGYDPRKKRGTKQ